MDRDLEYLAGIPQFSWRRLAVTVLVSAAILAVGTYLVRTFPYSGYQAGGAASQSGTFFSPALKPRRPPCG